MTGISATTSSFLLLTLALFVYSSNCAQVPDSRIYGRLVVPGSARFRDFRLAVQINAGESRVSVYVSNDGSFSLPPLLPGVHILTVAAVGEWIFPQLLIDVGSRTSSSVRISHFDSHKTVPVPIILKGLPISHFEVRKTLSLWGVLKSPYGIMICVMLFAIIVFPMMKLSPEEYRRANDSWSAPPPQPSLAPPSRRRT